MEPITLNPYIVDYVSKDYAGSVPEGEVKVDCSLGVNADLLGTCIFQRLHGPFHSGKRLLRHPVRAEPAVPDPGEEGPGPRPPVHRLHRPRELQRLGVRVLLPQPGAGLPL